MTNPTITYGVAYQNDCDDATGWNETESGLVASLATDGDIFTITGITDNVADEYAYYEKDITDIDTNTYPYFACRYRTSHASNAVGICIELVFTAGSQYVVGSVAPEFSTTWKVATATITPSKTLDKIRIHANDNPNNCPNGTYYVYVDWLMISKTPFTFPLTQPSTIKVHSQPRSVKIPIPGRMTDIKQYLGEGNIQIELTGDYDTNPSWYTGAYSTTLPLDYVLQIVQEMTTQQKIWQYFTSDKYKGKVTVEDFEFNQKSEGTSLGTWRLLLEEFRLKAPSTENIWERYGLI